MHKLTILLLTLLLPFGIFAQEESSNDRGGGDFELGMRSTLSLFGSNGYTGSGVGGQMRIRITDRLNTEWFADYITTNLGDVGRRVDGHIGWSVMFYPFNTLDKKFNPYLLAGHCFDYTSVKPSVFSLSNEEGNNSRWSSAVQMGLGTHYYLTPNVDIFLSGQYMLHLGSDIHAEVVTDETTGLTYLDMHDHNHGVGDNQTLEGHLFITLGVSLKLGKLW